MGNIMPAKAGTGQTVRAIIAPASQQLDKKEELAAEND